MKFVIALAVIGALTVAVGVGLVFMPAGVIVGGVEALCGAYMIGYLEARR